MDPAQLATAQVVRGILCCLNVRPDRRNCIRARDIPYGGKAKVRGCVALLMVVDSHVYLGYSAA